MLKIENLSYKYKDSLFGLESVNIDSKDKLVICLLGNSGCGKSTLLSLIMGLRRACSGKIFVNNICVDGGDSYVLPEKRNVGVAFQHCSLFPHRTVLENVMFAIKSNKLSVRKDEALKVLELFNLSHFANFYPSNLSGGQQQIITIARTVAQNSSVVLMDEPFASLDFTLRRRIRKKVFSILRERNVVSILVTHDPEEAMENADIIYVMNAGKVIQCGSPEDVYKSPNCKLVMDLFDDPICLSYTISGDSFYTPFGLIKKNHSFKDGDCVEMCIGSEAFILSENGIFVIVESRCILSKYIRFRLGQECYKMFFVFPTLPKIGEQIKIELNPSKVFVFLEK